MAKFFFAENSYKGPFLPLTGRSFLRGTAS
jgi:hypothetical protein